MTNRYLLLTAALHPVCTVSITVFLKFSAVQSIVAYELLLLLLQYVLCHPVSLSSLLVFKQLRLCGISDLMPASSFMLSFAFHASILFLFRDVVSRGASS